MRRNRARLALSSLPSLAALLAFLLATVSSAQLPAAATTTMRLAAAAPDSGWLRLTWSSDRLVGRARLMFPARARGGESVLVLGGAFTVDSVTVDQRPAAWRAAPAGGDSLGGPAAPSGWQDARVIRVSLPAPTKTTTGRFAVAISYAGPAPAAGAWAFRLRPGDLFHPIVAGTSLTWRVELPGVEPATVAGNVTAVGDHYATAGPVSALYLLGGRAGALPWRVRHGTRLVCLSPGGGSAPAAAWARAERLLARAAREWGPYPWPTLAIVTDSTRVGRPLAYPGIVETGTLPAQLTGEATLLHEILHGWFGLGVTAPARGDWSEGLCALLAEHDLRAEGDPAEAAAFRRGLLRQFTAIAGSPADVPLRDWAPGDTASDGVGYGKGLFFFLTLRHELGTARFAAGLRRLCERPLAAEADWPDLCRCFTATTESDLADFFTAWLDRPGGPRLVADDVSYDRARREVRVTVSQRPSATVPASVLERPRPAAAPWPLWLRLRLDGLSAPPVWVALERRERTIRIPAAVAPASVTVDPFWETFRLLVPDEPLRTAVGAGAR